MVDGVQLNVTFIRAKEKSNQPQKPKKSLNEKFSLYQND